MEKLQKKDKKSAETVENQKKNADRRKQSLFDRRKEEKRRKVYSIDYFSMDGVERRKRKERRKPDEQRNGWVRINKWISMFIGTKK